MKGNSHIGLVIFLCSFCLVGYSQIAPLLSGGVIVPQPTDPGHLKLLWVFEKNDSAAQAAKDAREFGCLSESTAAVIEVDGKQQQPQLRSGTQMHNHRNMTRYYQTGGATYTSRYPDLPAVLTEYLTTELGTDGGPVSAEQRAKWVKAHRNLAAQAFYVADYLTWKHGPFEGG